MIFDDSVTENKEVWKKYNEVWDRIENEIKGVNGEECNSIEENDYGKDYVKIYVWWWLTIKQTTQISCNDHNCQICFRRR